MGMRMILEAIEAEEKKYSQYRLEVRDLPEGLQNLIEANVPAKIVQKGLEEVKKHIAKKHIENDD